MLISQKIYFLNFIISKYNIKYFKELPLIKTTLLKVKLKKKSLYLKMTVFFLLYFLSDNIPKINLNLNLISLKISSLKQYTFLSKLNSFFLEFKNLYYYYYSINYSRYFLECRVNIYSLQIFFQELFFFSKIYFASWNHIVFKLEILFKFISKNINKNSLKDYLLLNF